MYLDSRDGRPSLTPQLAFRVAIIGGIALLAFALIFFRLWYLQVLSADSYRAQANDNRVRSIEQQAPRGEIVDREGRVLVSNRSGLSVSVSPKELPAGEADRDDLYRRLGRVLAMRPRKIEVRVEEQLETIPYSRATVKQDVPQETVAYLLENWEDFPGVEPERVFLRQYPHGEVGAHVLGYTGEVDESELEQERFRNLEPGDYVGKLGIEWQYDRFLRGRDGARRVEVDSLGNITGSQPLSIREPEQGRQLRLSLDLDVQQAGQQALASRGLPGGFVAMNVRNGQLLGIGSNPSFDPNMFSGRVSPRELAALEAGDQPIFNRAIQGGYASGSTFKLVTAVAALEGGLIEPGDVIVDGGSVTIGDMERTNAGSVAYGEVDMHRALSVSSDVYFYLLGQEADSDGDGLLIQRWARKLGIGRPTGIDLPGEEVGRVPTPRWRNRWAKQGLTERPWSSGDNVNLSIGQGDLLTNPLQMAIAYATVANGGKAVTPRLGMRIEDSSNRPLQELDAPPARRVDIDDGVRQVVLDGLHSAANDPEGTSSDLFADFPVEVAGKTGTVETTSGIDQSWYIALAPYPNPRFVVAATLERGGFGAETAAPAVREILTALFGIDEADRELAETTTD